MVHFLKKYIFVNRVIFPPLTAMQKYRIYYTLLLSSVPLVCGILVIALLSVFAKLNLYFLEANGLLLDDQVRDAYYSQMQLEVINVIWYLAAQMLAVMIASFVIVKWSNAPFISAQKIIRTAIDKPDDLKPVSKWFTESRSFDRVIWQFALQIKNKSLTKIENVPHERDNEINIYYFIKYSIAFMALSISMGYVTGIIIVSMYEKIVSLALVLVKNNQYTSLYYIAQQDILLDATNVAMFLSIFFYLLVGIQISRKMAVMTFVFSRSLRENKFPIFLRKPEIYHSLAETINEGYEKIKKS